MEAKHGVILDLTKLEAPNGDDNTDRVIKSISFDPEPFKCVELEDKDHREEILKEIV